MVAHCLEGVPIDQTELAIERATLLYARRQRTWWKSDTSVFARLTPEALLGDEAGRAIASQLAR
jgi:tRNA A37 N6-isopentenylltransferase MiaA